MKILKTLLICGAIIMSNQSFANPTKSNVTPIVFAKGSHCGMFSGNAEGRTFVLHLNANQELFISSDDIYSDTQDIIVKNPNNKTLQDSWLHGGVFYMTDIKGKYTIKVIPTTNHINLEFCAY